MKSKTDLVRLKNISQDGKNHLGNEYSKCDITFAFNGTEYTIPEGGSINVTREIAEHGVKKAYSYANRIHRASIEELPESQRSLQGLATASDEAQKLQERIDTLERENAALKYKAVPAEPEVEERKKPGRPKGS